MRVRFVLPAVLAMASFNIQLPAQTSKVDQLNQADRLRLEDHPKDAIAILESIIQRDGDTLTRKELGVAWNILGSSYQDLQMFNRARVCYQTAMETLRSIPTAQAPYAATIANLASLEDVSGQRDSSRALTEKANRIYEAIGDTGGIAITSTTLAMLSYSRNDYKAAHRHLARALEQAQRTSGLRDEDIAAMYSVKSALAFHEGKYEEALSSIQQAIDLWTHAHGPAASSLGLGLALRAQAVAKLGDYGRAATDAEHALAIVDATYGRNNAAYFRVQIVYAQILRASGQEEQASRLRKQADKSLADLASRQCSGCTINASGLR